MPLKIFSVILLPFLLFFTSDAQLRPMPMPLKDSVTLGYNPVVNISGLILNGVDVNGDYLMRIKTAGSKDTVTVISFANNPLLVSEESKNSDQRCVPLLLETGAAVVLHVRAILVPRDGDLARHIGKKDKLFGVIDGRGMNYLVCKSIFDLVESNASCFVKPQRVDFFGAVKPGITDTTLVFPTDLPERQAVNNPLVAMAYAQTCFCLQPVLPEGSVQEQENINSKPPLPVRKRQIWKAFSSSAKHYYDRAHTPRTEGWVTGNMTGAFSFCDTVRLYDNFNYIYASGQCRFVEWKFAKKNVFIQSEGHFCQEPPQMSVTRPGDWRKIKLVETNYGLIMHISLPGKEDAYTFKVLSMDQVTIGEDRQASARITLKKL